MLLTTEYLNTVTEADVYRMDGIRRGTRKIWGQLLCSPPRKEITIASSKDMLQDITAAEDEDIDSDTIAALLDIFKRLFLTDNSPFPTWIRFSIQAEQAKKRTLPPCPWSTCC